MGGQHDGLAGAAGGMSWCRPTRRAVSSRHRERGRDRCGLAFNPVLIAAISYVEPRDSGLASGITNTAVMMGGALGFAVLASLAAARTEHRAAAGRGTPASLTGGYRLAFVIGALFALTAARVGVIFLAPVRPAGGRTTPSWRWNRRSGSEHERDQHPGTRLVGRVSDRE